MQLIIDGKNAVLKKGSSFDYISENRSFSDADDYTLSITLPLADCPENLDIFGHIDRMDIDSRNIVFEASVIDRGFSKNGVVTVVGATDIEVKCQFLEGRSVQNFNTTFDEIYINDLDLGIYPASSLPHYPSEYLNDIGHGAEQVALPWVYDESGSIQNEMVYDSGGSLVWSQSAKDTGKLSFQPYLIVIARRICQAVGYTCDFSRWEASPDFYLLICNTLPAAWDIPQYGRILPHWSVSEFFEELEKILVCEIDIDHKAKHIGLTFCNVITESLPVFKIDQVVDSFDSEISYNDGLCTFKGLANLSYADRGDEKWKFEQCQWFIDLIRSENKYYKEFQTEREFLDWSTASFGILGPSLTGKDTERGKNVGMLMHIVESNRYGIWRVVHSKLGTFLNMYFYQWLDLNRFGDVIRDPDSDNDIELQCVPARIDYTDSEHGECLFLAPSAFNENEELDSDGIRQPVAYSNFLKGEQDSLPVYYDKIHLAYWNGLNPEGGSSTASSLCPGVDNRFSLGDRYASYMSGLKINPREKLKISFLSSVMPSVRSVFHIKGKHYLCEKITATFTENGMSQLLKGEFYPLLDD
ncbi:hypothetical protein [uncultured Duncaniella sp.]|uniref:hypothetical protein n=1 Tax=uncultured Duncaniella sp. TaxID=2768039 RepID=UPI0025A9D362|nr:hypothetical protein [uncultured Duncaniella sp.]